MQRRSPGGPTDRGLAMLVDQEDTPLFLGPIHRVLTGVGLDDLAAAAEVVGAGFDLVEKSAAVHALGPDTLVATDGRRWATVKLDVPDDRAAVELLHDDLVPALPRGPMRIDYHHSVGGHAQPTCRTDSVAVLMPAPDVDLVLRSPPTTGCCRRRPRRSSPSRAWACSSAPCATNDPAPRSARPRPARRVAPPARKNRRRRAPVTWTTSPSVQPLT